MKPDEAISDSFTVILTEDTDTDGYPCLVATHPELEGCLAQGRTREEALANLADARSVFIKSLEESGIEIPRPQTSGVQIEIMTAWVSRGPRG